jgi:hypothetical protein
MDHHAHHACITYVACRLITGKRPVFLYDLQNSQEIEIAGVLDIDFLREFEEKHRDYLPGYASNCTYRYTSGNGFSLDIFINKKTFIIHIKNSDAYFIGNLRNDTVYLHDHNKSTHFRYRITAYIEDHRKEEKKPVGEVMYGKDEDWREG